MAPVTHAVAAGKETGTDVAQESYDILILDGVAKQALTSTRSLGEAGIRVAVGESVGQYLLGLRPVGFSSRYCARAVELPDYVTDPDAYVSAILDFVRDHNVKVVLPTGDSNNILLPPHREQFSELGCKLAIASDEALTIANDKKLTLEFAEKLGIDFPSSIPVTDVADLREAADQFGYPFVLKPTISWTGDVAERSFPVQVKNETEALATIKQYLASGCEVLAQQWACGRREGITLLIDKGEVLAVCGAIAHRTYPVLGGVSVARESMAVPAELLNASVRLVTAIGLDGPCEVEWRRDAQGRPLLMEINARLSGALENAIKSGVDLPLMVWQWATGQPVQPVLSHKTGVRTRWLRGDMMWVRDNGSRIRQSDSVPLPRAIGTFLWEFVRTPHIDYINRRDMRPAVVEFKETIALLVNKFRGGNGPQ